MQSDPQTSSIRARAFLEQLEPRRFWSAGQLDATFGVDGIATKPGKCKPGKCTSPGFRPNFSVFRLISASIWLAGFGLITGCSLAAETYYSADTVYLRGNVAQIHIQKMRVWEEMLSIDCEAQNVIVDVNFASGSDSGGTVKLLRAHRLSDDPVRAHSTFMPILGTSKVIQFQDQYPETFRQYATTVYVHDTSQQRRDTIATFSLRGRDPERGLCAVNRTGSRLLVVTQNDAVLWDPAAKRILERDSGPLVELRRLIMEKRGKPGNWRLTEDMRYVVISPPIETETATGEEAGSDPIPISIGGMSVDINDKGLVFDRETKTFSLFPLRINYDTLLDAENVNGALRFVFGTGGHAEVTDADGNLIATHAIEANGYYFQQFAGWDPQRGEVWFHVGQNPTERDFSQAMLDHIFVSWNASTNVETRYRLTQAQIAAAIAKAK